MISQSHHLPSLFDQSTRLAARAVFQDRYVRAMDQLMRDALAPIPLEGSHDNPLGNLHPDSDGRNHPPRLDLGCFAGVTCPQCGAALQRANNVEHVCQIAEDDHFN